MVVTTVVSSTCAADCAAAFTGSPFEIGFTLAAASAPVCDPVGKMSTVSSRKKVEAIAFVALLAAAVRIAFKCVSPSISAWIAARPNLSDASFTNWVLYVGHPPLGADAPAGVSGAFRTRDQLCAWRYLAVDPSSLKTLNRRGASSSPGLPNRPESNLRKFKDLPTSHP